MKNHYVYLTTNMITGQQYISDHSINNKERIYYLGSGYEIIKAIKEYGRAAFFKEILEWFEYRSEACKSQEKYIKLFGTHISQGGYNISYSGGTHCNGVHSKETIELMKIKSKNKNKGKCTPRIKLLMEDYSVKPVKCKACGKTLTFKQRYNLYCSYNCSNKDKAVDEKINNKRAKSNTGKKRTEEQKHAMSIARRGIPSPFKGKIGMNKGKNIRNVKRPLKLREYIK